MRALALVAALALAACGPKFGDLTPGETGRVARAYGGDTLVLDSGLRVFLAEIDAPRGEDDYARQAQGELEALALHREVQLAYAPGARRWTPADGSAPQQETALAHVFVRSEGGRWFWLQHELIARGAAFVRPRRGALTRTDALLAVERSARGGERGLWKQRDWAWLAPRSAARAALKANAQCQTGAAPYRFLEADIASADIGADRASFTLANMPRDKSFAITLYGDDFAAWDGPDLNTLAGAHIRIRGPLGVFDETPQLCLETSAQLELTTP
ncbi:thermonuclease family protein [Terricaulis sp.]|uniref:thermonuclease family protein n=1 Tax=Terricaulis sp. TaxID=2768686 RepID=UPI003783400B